MCGTIRYYTAGQIPDPLLHDLVHEVVHEVVHVQPRHSIELLGPLKEILDRNKKNST